MKKEKKIKVMMAKAGLDGHDRGVLIVCMALRDAGMEVIYTGLHQTPEAIAAAATQENVDIIGLSSLADAHPTLAPRILNELKKRGRGDIPVILGGFIQPEDIPGLKKNGITEVFGLDVKLDTIVRYIRDKVAGLQE